MVDKVYWHGIIRKCMKEMLNGNNIYQKNAELIKMHFLLKNTSIIITFAFILTYISMITQKIIK